MQRGVLEAASGQPETSDVLSIECLCDYISLKRLSEMKRTNHCIAINSWKPDLSVFLQADGEGSGAPKGAGLTLSVPSNPVLRDALQIANVKFGGAAYKTGKIKVNEQLQVLADAHTHCLGTRAGSG